MFRSASGWIFLIIVTMASLASATVTSALINKALDSQQKLDLNTVLPDAMEQIGKVTGVRIEADPAVWDLLPWGEQTNITAKIENKTLRESLSAITQKLGLEFVLTDESILLRPEPALRRLGRRSTIQEIALLDTLASTPIDLTSGQRTVKDILAAADAKLDSIKSPFSVEVRISDASQQVVVGIARGATIAEALESISKQSNCTWYPWGKSIIVLSKHEQIRTQLAKTLTARYSGVEVSQVLLELFQRAGVDFTVDPSAYQSVPSEYRSIKLMLNNASVQQALESIGGYTGLSFEVTDNGVHVIAPSTASTTQSIH